MGRYDSRLKVYNGSTWKNVAQLRVYNGSSWIDLGNNESADTKSLYVRTNNGNKRITLNKQVITSSETHYRGYHQGSISTTTEQRYCFYNTASGVPNTKFYVYIKFIAQGASNLFSFSANSGATTFELKVDANGLVHYKIHDSMFAHNDWDEPLGYISMGFNQGWQTVEINSDWGSATYLGTKVNGGDYKEIRWHTAWDARVGGTIGSNNTRIKTDGLNINTAGAAHTYVPDDSYTETVTSVNWV